jgi:hypothetical protein
VPRLEGGSHAQARARQLVRIDWAQRGEHAKTVAVMQAVSDEKLHTLRRDETSAAPRRAARGVSSDDGTHPYPDLAAIRRLICYTIWNSSTPRCGWRQSRRSG